MTDVRTWIDRCCRRLNRGVVLRTAADWLAVWLCAFGTSLLVVKYAWPGWWPHVLWGAATLVPVLVLAGRRALRQRFLASDGAALLDRRLGTDGLLMTVSERGDARWGQTLPGDEQAWLAALPRLRPVRFARIVALPLAFAATALLIPARAERQKSRHPRGPALQTFAELPDAVQAAAEAGLFEDSTEYQRRKEEAEDLKQATTGAPPSAHQYQQEEAIRTRIQNLAENERRVAERGRNAARELAASAKTGKTLSTRRRQQLERDVAAALKRAADRRDRAGTKEASGAKPAPRVQKTTIAKTPKSAAGSVPKKGNPDGSQAAGGKVAARTTAKHSDGKKSTGSAKTGSAKQGSGKTPQSPGGPTPDLKQALELASRLPPELQRELLRMAREGRFQLPDDPELRRKLMEQARRLLQQDSRKLAELQRRFAGLAQNLRGRAPLPDVREGDGFTSRPFKADTRLPTGRSKTDGSGASSDEKDSVSRPATRDPRSSPKRNGVSFRDVVLPPGVFDKPRSRDAKVTARAPQVNPVKPSKTAGSDGPLSASNGSTFKRSYRPRYRELIYKYFNR